jgi:hypothetical protein
VGVTLTTITRTRADSGVAGARRTLAVYAASRVLTLAVMWIAAHRVGYRLIALLSSWDGNWFLTVVRSGYPNHVPVGGAVAAQSTLPFFPLYPLATRAAAWVLPGSDAWAAIAVSLACGAIGAILVHRLTELVADRRTADRVVVLYCLFPGSMVLSWAYSEALTVTLAAGCLIALLRQRWLLAGVLAGAATACRANAVVLVAVCLWEATAAVRRDRTWRPLLAPAIAPTGIIAFFGYLWAHTGDPLAFLHAEEAWGVQPGAGRRTLHMIWSVVRAPTANPTFTIAVISLGFAVLTAVVLVRRPWPPMLSVYALGILAFSVVSRSDGLRPRDILIAFPLLMALGAAASATRFRQTVMIFVPLLLTSLVFHGIHTWAQP